MPPKFERRVRAFAIDTAAVMIVVIIMAFTDYLETHLRIIPVIGAILLFFFIPYFISRGQSFGKRIEKIKIVNLDGSEANYFKIIIRELFVVSLSILTVGIYLVIAYFALTEKKVSMTIHDRIFKTKEIDLIRPVVDNSYDYKNGGK